MAMIVRSEHDLPTIRVLLDRTGGHETDVIFQAVRGPDNATEVYRCRGDDLGLPDQLDRASDGAFRVPDGLWPELTRAIEDLGPSPVPPRNGLWLELPSPRGYLYVMPWERLLTPLQRPILRLPNHTVRPRAATDTLDVALCASAPRAKTAFDTVSIVRDLAQLWIERPQHRVTVHIFSDHSSYTALIDAAAPFGNSVLVHDPAGAAGYAPPERASRVATATLLTNPWLLWMRKALGGRAVDAVHFVGHGYLAGDRGAVAVAGTPTRDSDQSWARFVGAAELSTFMAHVGAWTLALTGPPYNYSLMGLRELADAIALVRPGISLVHDAALDGSGLQLGAALEMALGAGVSDGAAMPSITCWTHPLFVEYPEQDQAALMLTEDGHSSLIKQAMQKALAADDTPAWVAAGTRYLENRQANWLPDQTDEDVDPDAVAALESVSALLEKHVTAEYSGELGRA